jgi:hypothetical protein
MNLFEKVSPKGMTANIFQPKLHRKSLLSLFHKFDKEKKKEKKNTWRNRLKRLVHFRSINPLRTKIIYTSTENKGVERVMK